MCPAVIQMYLKSVLRETVKLFEGKRKKHDLGSRRRQKCLLITLCPNGEAGCSYWGVLKQREVGVAVSVELREMGCQCCVRTWAGKLLEGQVSLLILMGSLKMGSLGHFGRMLIYRYF